MSIIPRGEGLQISVQVTRDGKKLRHRETVHCTMDEAKAHEAQVKADLMAGRTPDKYSAKPTLRRSGIVLEEAVEAVYEKYWAHGSMARTIRSNIADCYEFFGNHTLIKDIQTSDADEFIAWLKGKGLAASTIRSKCCVMTKMFNHYHRRGNLETKPYFEMPSPGDNTRDRVISDEEEIELFRIFDVEWDNAAQRFAHCGQEYADLYAVLMDTGMRPSEARAMDARNLRNGMITLKKTKTGLMRTIPLTKRAQAAIERQVINHGDTPFGWATNAIIRHSWNFARSVMALDDDEGFIPYALRHTCATRLYDKTRDLLIVQKWLGHKTITMTLRYAKLQPDDLEKARDLLEAA